MEWCKRDVSSHDKALQKQLMLSQVNGINACLAQNDVDILLVPSDAKKATKISAMAGM